MTRLTFALALAALLGASPAPAGWTNNALNGYAVVAGSDIPEWVSHLLALDNGNTFVAYAWNLNYELPLKLKYQILDPQGNCLLGENGRFVIIGEQHYGHPIVHLLPDGEGGVIVVFGDSRAPDGFPDIYGQRFDIHGLPLWDPFGVPLAIYQGTIWPLVGINDAIMDSLGNFYLSYSANLVENWVINENTYIQRFDREGNIYWGSGGLPLSEAPHAQYNAKLVSDGRGGVIAVWNDARTGQGQEKLYGQHLDSLGHSLWTPGGQLLEPSGSGIVIQETDLVKAVPDGAGGGIFGGYRWWNDSWVLFRLNGQGTVEWLHVHCYGMYNGLFGDLHRHPADGSVWFGTGEERVGETGHYLYRFSVDGQPLFGLNGLPLGGDDAFVPILTLTSDGVIAVVNNAHAPYAYLRASRVNMQGQTVWTTYLNVWRPYWIYDQHVGVTDGADGMVYAWTDFRDPYPSIMSNNVYAQRVQADGTLGIPGPLPPWEERPVPQAGLEAAGETVRYRLERAGPVTLELYDLLGRRVAVLVDGWREAGSHQAAFDGTALASGVYLYRLQAHGRQAVGKMALVK